VSWASWGSSWANAWGRAWGYVSSLFARYARPGDVVGVDVTPDAETAAQLDARAGVLGEAQAVAVTAEVAASPWPEPFAVRVVAVESAALVVPGSVSVVATSSVGVDT
jgi:hypothetical protein